MPVDRMKEAVAGTTRKALRLVVAEEAMAGAMARQTVQHYYLVVAEEAMAGAMARKSVKHCYLVQPHGLVHRPKGREMGEAFPSNGSWCRVDTAIVCCCAILTILEIANTMILLPDPPAACCMAGPPLEDYQDKGCTRKDS